MSKADRNRQTARAKIARMQALEAQRRRRRNWIAGIGAAVLVILTVTGIDLVVTSSSTPATARGRHPGHREGRHAERKLAALSHWAPSSQHPLPARPDPKASP